MIHQYIDIDISGLPAIRTFLFTVLYQVFLHNSFLNWISKNMVQQEKIFTDNRNYMLRRTGIIPYYLYATLTGFYL